MSVLNWAIRGDEDDAVSERFVQLMDSLHVDTWYENFFRDPLLPLHNGTEGY